MTRFLHRIGSAWHALTAKSAPPAGAYSYAWGGSAWADAFRSRRAPTPAELVDSYKSLVYACANLNAQAVARTPLRLYAVTRSQQQRPKCPVAQLARKDNERLKGLSYAARTIAGAQHVEEVTDHPLLDALLKVNDDLDYAQLIAYTVLSLDIVGSAYWWPSLGKFRTPEEFWALPPHLVFPVFTSGTMVPDAYTFGGLTYPKADLIRFRRLSAKNPYGQGYGPHQAAIEYARLEDTFVSIQDNLLANGPRPSIIVSHRDPKGAFGPAERQRLEADMERRGRGGRAGSVFVVDGAAAVTPVSYSPADLGGLQVSAYDMERIANCFDVPVSMLKTEDVNRANAEAGLAQHGRHAVEPRCKLIASALTRWTHSLDARGRLGWGRLFWAFDAVVAEDKAAEAELHRTYLDLGVLTRNEVRLELGYEPAEGGDALLVSGALARLTDVANPHDDTSDPDEDVNPETEPHSEGADEWHDDEGMEGEREEQDREDESVKSHITRALAKIFSWLDFAPFNSPSAFDAESIGREVLSSRKAEKRKPKPPKKPNCGTGPGGFQPDNQCQRRRRGNGPKKPKTSKKPKKAKNPKTPTTPTVVHAGKVVDLRKFKFGAYLKTLIGDPPAGMIHPHAHHILFKRGLGPEQKELVKEGQALLRKHGFDPIFGVENLVWAPNRVHEQHGIDALRHVVKTLRDVDNAGKGRAGMAKALKKLGELAAQRKGKAKCPKSRSSKKSRLRSNGTMLKRWRRSLVPTNRFWRR